MSNYSFNPRNAKTARDHRPLRWIVKQYFTEESEQGDFYRHEVWTGYNCALDSIKGMTYALSQARSNLKKFGGELYADYGSKEGPVFVESH